ncbi:hypothetical protein QL285_064512 [Trifolium repens]|nr:hypothetical protein QL285_064512 [Trifolium repens]
MSSVLGNGKDIGFWKEKWIGTDTLKNLYPDLYLKSSLQNGSVSMMGSLDHNAWVWRFDWIDTLSDSEVALEQELLNLLHPFQPRPDVEDRYRWISSSAGIFSVKCAYIELLNRSAMANLDDSMVYSLDLMWKNNVPSKISIFGWRLLLEKLPTREALFDRGIITNSTDRNCAFCSNHVESMAHAFIHCNFSTNVWRRIFNWMGLYFINSNSIQQHFIRYGELIKSKATKVKNKHRHIIWLATMWCIWRGRNNIVFREDRITIGSLVDQIIYMSWFWFSGRLRSVVAISFDSWCTNPLNCLQCV